MVLKIGKSWCRLLTLFGLLALSTINLAAEGPKNIIFMIGDGMGPAHLAAYRHFIAEAGDTSNARAGAPTIFDRLLTGLSATHSADRSLVTDSAAAATALATGHKTCNQFVAMSCDGRPLPTLFQRAKSQGMRTGIAVSSQVNHATPAAFYAHQKSRHAYNAIADQLLDNRIGERLPVDVILGGGTRYFSREDRNLIDELRALGYSYADNWQALSGLTLPALALLAPVGLPSAIDNPVEGALAKLTDTALKLLHAGDEAPGFVLMVEGSQIDWCGHAKDIVCAMAEMHDFALAAQVAKAFVDANPDTLLVITSDHETGGLSLGCDGLYDWRPEVLRGVTVSPARLAELLVASDSWLTLWETHTAIALNKNERSALTAARAKGESALLAEIKSLMDQKSHTGWTSHGHTAVDVPLMAYGKGSEAFRGLLDIAEIGRRLLVLIKQPAAE